MIETFVDVDCWRVQKFGQNAEGDTFLSRRDGERIMTVLSDGLGSGIKASVLSTLTTTLALRCLERNLPLDRTAKLIMNSLPVCSQRKIAYATFTLLDIQPNRQVNLWEFDNPPAFLVRDNQIVDVERIPTVFMNDNRPQKVFRLTFQAQTGDRLLFCSDGVTQSGMGTRPYPLGWGIEKVRDFTLDLLGKNPRLSARKTARAIVQEALIKDGGKAKDDISCGALYFREPRKLLVLTGPPFHPEDDHPLARRFAAFTGKKIVCGGTTAQLLSRELGHSVTVDLKSSTDGLPPPAFMDGADLVTEGILTLGRVAEMLESRWSFETLPNSPALDLVLHFLDADRIEFIVGTRVNEAHQDPKLPIELEIRRNLVKRIVNTLEEKFMKEVDLSFF